jgi:epoxyqueuosine reductase
MKSDLEQLKSLAQSMGFELLGIVDPHLRMDNVFFKRWLDEGKNASMHYLEKYPDVRVKAANLLSNSQSMIILGIPYTLSRKEKHRPRVAGYALNEDYHRFAWRTGQVLSEQLRKLITTQDAEIQFRVVSDSAPLLERAYANRCETGFIGKNTMFIHPQLGSAFLLCEILTTHCFQHDQEKSKNNLTRSPQGGCGTCKRCQVHCPTGALDSDYQIDASRCLSYWNIEHRGVVPLEFWIHFKRFFYGCDICQSVCPYNRVSAHAVKTTKLALRSRHDLDELDLRDIASMDQQYYEKKFGGTPMTRAKKSGLRRNAIIAMAATNDERLDHIRASLQNDPCEIVSGTARQIDAFRALIN